MNYSIDWDSAGERDWGIRDITRRAAESRAREIEAAIVRFRECGVEIERFSLIERAGEIATTLCVDGIPRFTWRLDCDLPGWTSSKGHSR